jgi:cellulose synthase/poly-beta-1,6-N-acetylglucosamine synthase-like glycosyltransferase
MNLAIILFAIASGIGYLAFTLFLWTGWKKDPPFTATTKKASIFISVIVAFRNEENNLPSLIQCLVHQNYDRDMFEVIMVNDHSADSSVEIIKENALMDSRFRLIELSIALFGKKAAIQTAVSTAKGNLVVCTDADCNMGNEWLSTIAACYFETGKKLILGPVDYNSPPGIIAGMLNLEFLSLIGSAAGSAAHKHPILCNGANLAFERTIYPSNLNQMNPAIASGDDIQLLLYTKEKLRSQITFLKSVKALVKTTAPSGLAQFFNQRKRWAAKSFTVNDTDIKIAAGAVALQSISFIILFTAAFFSPLFIKSLLVFLGIKILADTVFLLPVLGFFNKVRLIAFIPLLEIVYPWYICIIAMLSITGKYSWKGRRYRK